MIEKLKLQFERIFGKSDELHSFFAPGRVNLIGEHTDYNGGHVFPSALSIGTYAIARKRADDNVVMYSLNFVDKGFINFAINELQFDEADDWGNYPKGVLKVFIDSGFTINSGIDLLFYGNIPNGAGLSSSASIELVTSVMLKDLFNLDVSMVEMVKLSQKAENEFVGVSCGIMDQFAIGMGKKGHAVLLDCKTLEYQHCPIQLDHVSLIIANTNKQRGLQDSKYNLRRLECERALLELRKKIEITSLGELTVDQFEHLKDTITNDTDRRRAKHAVYENARTIKAVELLKKGDIGGFGELMNQSHISLRDDYEVTCLELDSLVEAAWVQPGVIGSRMTGAGFGGCTISIVENDKIENFIENVGKAYHEKTSLNAVFYVVEIGDGAKKL